MMLLLMFVILLSSQKTLAVSLKTKSQNSPKMKNSRFSDVKVGNSESGRHFRTKSASASPHLFAPPSTSSQTPLPARVLGPVQSGFEAPQPGQVTCADPVQTGFKAPHLVSVSHAVAQVQTGSRGKSDDVMWPVGGINQEIGENIAFCNKVCAVYTVFDEEKDNFLGAEAKVGEVSHGLEDQYAEHLDALYLPSLYPF